MFDLTSLFLTLILAFIIKYNWNRRWLYYYGSKLDGPFGWPIFGSAHYLMGGHKVFYKNVAMLLKSSEVAKIWIGPTLVVAITKPEYVEIVLNKCLEKPKFYEFGKQIVGTGILTAPIDIWKSRRKMINPTFNPNILNSFVEIFGRHAFHLANALEENCKNDSFDILPKLFRCTFDTACETLGDVDSTLLHGREEIFQNLTKAEDLLTTRVFSVWLHPDFFWNMTWLCRKLDKASKSIISIVKQVIQLKKSSDIMIQDNIYKEKRFVNHLLKLSEINPKLDKTALEDEIRTILLTGSETTALTAGFTLIILGIYPEIQEKVGKELDFIFGKNDRVPTLEDINKMEYLERVIKETLRLLSPVPFMLRTNNQDIKLDSNTIPAGSCILIPIFHIHKKPEYWKNPNEFDPDRFLPENSSNRPRCAFIPFSSGPRNCIGFKYGMMSVKILLATILRKYTVTATEYKKLEDIEMLLYVVNKPISGCKIKLEKK